MKPIEVLLIEDNPGDAFLVSLVLAESETPIKVQLARDGMQALLMLASDAVCPDLIILDLNIPNISGYQVLERYPQKEIPVVVFSSSWDKEDRRRSLALGARDYVRKPIGAEAYRDAVCGMVEKWARRPDDANRPKSTRSRRVRTTKYSTQSSS
jgi:CheY-like chemotaxis protein